MLVVSEETGVISMARAGKLTRHLDAEAIHRYCALEEDCSKMMSNIYESLHLTARSYHRILKTARTIADLAGESVIRTEHLAEAVSYRAVDRKYWENALRAA